MTTGVIKRIVVTLSNTADTTAVMVHKAATRGQTRPLVTLKAQNPM